jgi:hypothetical protein
LQRYTVTRLKTEPFPQIHGKVVREGIKLTERQRAVHAIRHHHRVSWFIAILNSSLKRDIADHMRRRVNVCPCSI